jgi:hypothetical protein|tara:strand:+ start:287 stop:439 length:153 start_codon:yes stop_codon:yes gene_type:complete
LISITFGVGDESTRFQIRPSSSFEIPTGIKKGDMLSTTEKMTALVNKMIW